MRPQQGDLIMVNSGEHITRHGEVDSVPWPAIDFVVARLRGPGVRMVLIRNDRLTVLGNAAELRRSLRKIYRDSPRGRKHRLVGDVARQILGVGGAV